jgi:hypothetical protein
MNLSKIERISAEWESIKETAFWGLFVAKIKERRDTESRFCEVNAEVAKSQGALLALDFVLGRGLNQPPLAERLLDELRKGQDAEYNT